jgi:hypothetical protein
MARRTAPTSGRAPTPPRQDDPGVRLAVGRRRWVAVRPEWPRLQRAGCADQQRIEIRFQLVARSGVGAGADSLRRSGVRRGPSGPWHVSGGQSLRPVTIIGGGPSHVPQKTTDLDHFRGTGGLPARRRPQALPCCLTSKLSRKSMTMRATPAVVIAAVAACLALATPRMPNPTRTFPIHATTTAQAAAPAA